MSERVSYLNDNSDLRCPDELFEKFKSAESEALKIVNLHLKAGQKGSYTANELERFISYIKNIQETEKYALNKYYEYNKIIFDNV